MFLQYLAKRQSLLPCELDCHKSKAGRDQGRFQSFGRLAVRGGEFLPGESLGLVDLVAAGISVLIRPSNLF